MNEEHGIAAVLTPLRGMRLLLVAVAAGVVYYLAGVVGLSMTFVHSSVSPVWPPTGVAIATMALFGLRLWPVFLLGAFLFNMDGFAWSSDPHLLQAAAFIAAGNTTEGLIGAWMLRRLGGVEAFSSAPRTFLFLGAGGVLGPAFSATVGVSTLVLQGLAMPQAFGPIWLTWWLGDLGGAIVLAPPLVLWLSRRPPPGAVSKGLLGAGVAGIAGALAFGPLTLAGWGLWLLLPILAWGILRLGPRATSTMLVAIAAAAIAQSLHGTGPFFHGDENEALLLLQLFLAFVSTATLLLAAGRRSMLEIEARRDPSQDVSARGGRWLPVTLALVPLILASVLAAGWFQETRSAAYEARLDAHADTVANAWGSRWDVEEQRMRAIQGFFGASESVTREEFRDFVLASGWLDAPDAAQAVSFDRMVQAEDLAAFEAQRQDELGVEFSIHPPGGTGSRYIVDYIVPQAGNEEALGLDIGAEAVRLEAVARALATDEVVTSRPVELVQGGTGVLTVARIAERDDPARSRGVVVSINRIDALLTEVDLDLASVHVNASYAIYPTGMDGPGFGDTDREVARTGAFRIPGGEWHLSVADPAGIITRTEQVAPWASLTAGGGLSISFAGVVYAYDNTRRRAYTIADSMAARIRENERQLAKSESQRAELDRMRRINRFKTEFINLAAHELRTPLVPLQAQLFILRRHGLFEDDTLGEVMAVMDRNVARMGNIVEDLLQSARLQADEIEIDRADTDVAGLVATAIQAYLAPADQAGISLTWEHVGPVTWRLDADRIAQILDNLIGNAVKFTPKGGHIHVRSESTPEAWTLEVKDDGLGIAADDIRQLFEPFTMVHDTNAITAPGSGLGLYICRAIARLHGGTIRAASDGPGKGSTFTVRVPPPKQG